MKRKIASIVILLVALSAVWTANAQDLIIYVSTGNSGSDSAHASELQSIVTLFNTNYGANFSYYGASSVLDANLAANSATGRVYIVGDGIFDTSYYFTHTIGTSQGSFTEGDFTGNSNVTQYYYCGIGNGFKIDGDDIKQGIANNQNLPWSSTSQTMKNYYRERLMSYPGGAAYLSQYGYWGTSPEYAMNGMSYGEVVIAAYPGGGNGIDPNNPNG